MVPTLAAACTLGVLSPGIRAWMMGVPLSLLSIGMALRSFAATAMTVIAFGALARVTLIFVTSAPPPVLSVWAAGVALAVGTPLTILSARRRRRRRGALLLAYRLKDAEVREQALAALRKLVAKATPKPGSSSLDYMQMVLMLAAPLTAFGLSEDLERWLGEVAPVQLDAKTTALRAQALATCRLEGGDLAGAVSALDEVDLDAVDGVLGDWLTATSALLLSVTGKPEEALSTLGEDEEDIDPALLASRSIVRAHVLMARDDEAGAEAELNRAVDVAGGAALHRAMHPRGPASRLAERLRGEWDDETDELASDDAPDGGDP